MDLVFRYEKLIKKEIIDLTPPPLSDEELWELGLPIEILLTEEDLRGVKISK
jgi:hypothetical protein